MSEEIKTTKTTIGIPVYNEIQFIERTITSALGQADQIVISDNASTDGTSELCQEYAKKHPEIKYFRFDKNMGIISNFINCAKLSDNDYFMYLGGHDLISRNYIKELKKILDTTDVILAHSSSVFLTDEYSFNRMNQHIPDMFEELGSDNPSVRIHGLLNWGYSCMIHGLYKKEYLEKALEVLKKKPEIIDHGLTIYVALLGRVQFCSNSTYYSIMNREPESNDIMCERVMKSIYADNYNPDIHIPERLITAVCEFKMSVAYKASVYSDDANVYLSKIKKIILLSKWWPLNSYVINYLKNLESFKSIKDNLETVDDTCTNNLYNEILELNTMLVNSNKKLNKLINSIAWWIPIKKWRDNFRKDLV